MNTYDFNVRILRTGNSVVAEGEMPSGDTVQVDDDGEGWTDEQATYEVLHALAEKVSEDGLKDPWD